MSKNESQVELTLFYITSTERALCVAVDDDEASEEIWLPKVYKGDELAWTRKGVKITIWAPEELLFEKGLI